VGVVDFGGASRSVWPQQRSISRRQFGVVTAGCAAATWVAPSVVGLDRVAAATPSGFAAFEYTEDFQGAIGNADASWSTVRTAVAPSDPARRFLGRFARANSVTLTAALPAHTTVSISFDLYILGSFDGSHVGGFNDRIRVQVDGATEFNESFAQAWLQSAGRLQTFGPNATNPAGTGAVETNTLGFTWRGNPADTVYRIELLDIPHTASTVQFTIRGLNLQGRNDESWGIDNFSLVAC